VKDNEFVQKKEIKKKRRRGNGGKGGARGSTPRGIT